MMRSIVAATLTAALLALVACETAQKPAGDLALARSAISTDEADPGIAQHALDAPGARSGVDAGEGEREAPGETPTPVTRVMLDDMHVAQTERGLVLTLEDATFDKNLAVLKPGARRGLDLLAKFLKENPGRRVQIEAFTDDAGSNVYNLELSQDRADAVALAVIDQGVDAARVRAIGWGERYAVAGNDTEQNRERNRRVEITVSKGDAAVPVRVVNAP